MAQRRGKFRTEFRDKKGKLVYSIRNADGTFANIESVKCSMRVERRTHAKKIVKSGYGFRGDTKKRK